MKTKLYHINWSDYSIKEIEADIEAAQNNACWCITKEATYWRVDGPSPFDHPRLGFKEDTTNWPFPAEYIGCQAAYFYFSYQIARNEIIKAIEQKIFNDVTMLEKYKRERLDEVVSMVRNISKDCKCTILTEQDLPRHECNMTGPERLKYEINKLSPFDKELFMYE